MDTTKLDCREIDSVVVKGKDRPVRIFEVIDGEPPEIAGLKLDSLAQFCEAMSLYKTQQFAKARGLFKAILSHGGSDNVAALYVERCETLEMAGIRRPGMGSRAHTEVIDQNFPRELVEVMDYRRRSKKPKVAPCNLCTACWPVWRFL